MLETVEHLTRLTPGEAEDRGRRKKAQGNKAAFLRAACGTMSKTEAARLRKLIRLHFVRDEALAV